MPNPGGTTGVPSIDLQMLLDERVRERTAELTASETRLRRITDHMVDLVAEFDDRGYYCYASPSYERVLGYHPDELVGTWAPEKIHPDERKTVIAAIGAMLAAGE